jgi:hypothetical protein
VLGLFGAALLVGARIVPDRRVDTKVATAPPVAPPAQAAEVSVEITVRPASAKIFIDGIPVPHNPHQMKAARSDASHEIRAEAEGYETRSLVVSFDRDRGLDMMLNKAAPPPASPPTTVARATGTGITAPAHAAPAHAPPAGHGIRELEPAKPKTGAKHDKIDTDVFRR